jgi:hypothetical protein
MPIGLFPMLGSFGATTRIVLVSNPTVPATEVYIDDILVGYSYVENAIRKFSSIRPISVSDMQDLTNKLGTI